MPTNYQQEICAHASSICFSKRCFTTWILGETVWIHFCQVLAPFNHNPLIRNKLLITSNTKTIRSI